MRRSIVDEHAGIPSWGVDLAPEARPGVPKERLPAQTLSHAHWGTPARQIPRFQILKRSDLPELTPVFGTAAPLHGFSGMIRRVAYGIPEYRVSHWMLLLAADRVDAVESNPGRLIMGVLVLAALLAGSALVLARLLR